MNIDMNSDEQLIQMLEKNYVCLQGQYRLGNFEDQVDYVHMWGQFYELKAEEDRTKVGDIPFKNAVDNFHVLIEYVERERPAVAAAHAVLLLKSKSLVYEVLDYTLKSSKTLEKYFKEMAEGFDRRSTPEEMERWAEELNQGKPLEPLDERTKVIKSLLIAALLGVNYHIRQHSRSEYQTALQLLEKIQKYVVDELPHQHSRVRESFGLLGLTLFLKGRVLMAQGTYERSREAFRQSAEAYVNRLRQKEEFFRDHRITQAPYRQKTSVTLRRAALVTAFGDGYLSFLGSQINRALEALTLARATLTQNGGRIHLSYVDVWYYACQRAKHSSNEEEIDKVIKGLESSCETLMGLAKNTRYAHRAAVEMALALYYKAKLSAQDDELFFEQAMNLLQQAIDYAEVINEKKEYKNPHLLGDALIYKSYFLRAHFRSSRKSVQRPADFQDLMLALAAAEKARDVSEKQGTAPLKSEAWAALGAVYTDLVEYRQGMGEDYFVDFDKALQALRRALKDTGGNVRLNAACYLRLARLSLLNPDTKLMAYGYFEQWKKLEDQVEHAYLREMARDLEGEDKLAYPYILVRANKSLEYAVWEKELKEKLYDAATQRFIHELPDYDTPDEDRLEREFISHLVKTVGPSRSTVATLVREGGLFEGLKELLEKRGRPVRKAE